MNCKRGIQDMGTVHDKREEGREAFAFIAGAVLLIAVIVLAALAADSGAIADRLAATLAPARV